MSCSGHESNNIKNMESKIDQQIQAIFISNCKFVQIDQLQVTDFLPSHLFYYRVVIHFFKVKKYNRAFIICDVDVSS